MGCWHVPNRFFEEMRNAGIEVRSFLKVRFPLFTRVVSRKELSDKTLKLNVGEKVDTTFITDVLHSYGFEYVDYVYEPGH